MAVDVSSQAYQALRSLIERLLGSPEEAGKYLEDPGSYLAAYGVSDYQYDASVVQQVISECAGGPYVPAEAKQALYDYAQGGYEGHQSVQQVVQHVNKVVQESYYNNEYITQQVYNYDNSTNVDNSTEVYVGGDVHGDLDVETTNVTATEGGVAAGGDITDSGINTGENSGFVGNLDVDASGGDGGGQGYEGPGSPGGAGGDVDLNLNFGGGNQNVDGTQNVGGNQVFGDVQDSALAAGGDAANVSNNEIYDGSAASAGGDATGYHEDTDVDAQHSIVATEQGAGDLDQHAQQEEPAGDPSA
jgi:hypothetical protein